MILSAIPAGENAPKDINVIIEVPLGGEPIKYEMDKASGAMFVDRYLYTSMRYPCNYGFIPHTLSDDGDPTDVLVVGQRAEHFSLERPEIIERQVSVDGTRKYLVRMAPGIEVESVFIPDVSKTGALCVSSQVGCTLTCKFCHTGTQRLVRNLTPREIILQIIVARDDLDEWPTQQENRKLTNIVFMGMGEPLYNTDNVCDAIDIMSDETGLSIGRRRVTVSTSGVVPDIVPMGARTNAMLAISLHAANDELRTQIMPINKKYPLAELMQACRDYPSLSNAKRITFEYVMLKGINDSPKHARELITLLQGIPAKVNLIPFNPWPGSDYECSDWETIERFGQIVNKSGLAAPIRTPRGRDILAACGQLKSESEKKRASEIRAEAAQKTD